MQNKRSAGLQKSNANSGDLISVGADGRGGRIKVLRSINQASLVSDNSSSDLQMYMCSYSPTFCRRIQIK